jgi:hypothetical protein
MASPVLEEIARRAKASSEDEARAKRIEKQLLSKTSIARALAPAGSPPFGSQANHSPLVYQRNNAQD